MLPQCVHQVRQKVPDRCIACEQHGHHIGDDLVVGQRRAILLRGDQNRYQVVAAGRAPQADLIAEKADHAEALVVAQGRSCRPAVALKQALRELGCAACRLRVETEHPAERTEQQRTGDIGDEVAAAPRSQSLQGLRQLGPDPGQHKFDPRRRDAPHDDAAQFIVTGRVHRAERLADSQLRIGQRIAGSGGKQLGPGKRIRHVRMSADEPEPGLRVMMNWMIAAHPAVGRVGVGKERLAGEGDHGVTSGSSACRSRAPSCGRPARLWRCRARSCAVQGAGG